MLAAGLPGCRANRRVYGARLRVHTDVRLHAEGPLVSILGLMHSGSRMLSAFLVELGPAAMVASGLARQSEC